jgi:hypothetical protein
VVISIRFEILWVLLIEIFNDLSTGFAEDLDRLDFFILVIVLKQFELRVEDAFDYALMLSEHTKLSVFG